MPNYNNNSNTTVIVWHEKGKGDILKSNEFFVRLEIVQWPVKIVFY